MNFEQTDKKQYLPSTVPSNMNTDMEIDLEQQDEEQNFIEVDKPKFRTVDKDRRRKKREKRKKAQQSYIKQNLKLISSALFISGAIGMIVVGAIRFSELEQQSVHDVILNFYFLFLGIVLAFHEFDVRCAVSNFRFLQYHWGKSILCIFLCSISFSNNQQTFIQYVTSLYFFVVGCCFLVLTCADRQHDRDIDAKFQKEQGMLSGLDDSDSREEVYEKA